ncbi:hypothetical protein JAB8_45510 [Janthinobacterium sp. HH106]|nr:hypothetical protein JAB8_45510 [Janthinobacterium sp. HH106]
MNLEEAKIGGNELVYQHTRNVVPSYPLYLLRL